MTKKKEVESVKPKITSFDEAMARLQDYMDTTRYRHDPYVGEITAEELRPIIQEIWDAAQSDKKSFGNSNGGRRYRDPKRR